MAEGEEKGGGGKRRDDLLIVSSFLLACEPNGRADSLVSASLPGFG